MYKAIFSLFWFKRGQLRACSPIKTLTYLRVGLAGHRPYLPSGLLHQRDTHMVIANLVTVITMWCPHKVLPIPEPYICHRIETYIPTRHFSHSRYVIVLLDRSLASS